MPAAQPQRPTALSPLSTSPPRKSDQSESNPRSHMTATYPGLPLTWLTRTSTQPLAGLSPPPLSSAPAAADQILAPAAAGDFESGHASWPRGCRRHCQTRSWRRSSPESRRTTRRASSAPPSPASAGAASSPVRDSSAGSASSTRLHP